MRGRTASNQLKRDHGRHQHRRADLLELDDGAGRAIGASGIARGQIVNLILTIAFGSTFLVVKYFEYKEKFEHHLVPVRTSIRITW